MRIEDTPREIATIPFGEALWPWIREAGKRVSQSKVLSDEAFFSLEKMLVGRLSALFSPAFALEMGICKYAETLVGKTRRARYRDFIKKRLVMPHLRDFFAEYQPLEQKGALLLEQWSLQVQEFQSRLERDLPELEALFHCGKPLGPVTTLQTGLSDPHNGGRQAFGVTFASGLKLFYKPKSVSIVSAFHTLLDQLNAWGQEPKLEGYRVLVRENYGWEECVEHTPCHNAVLYYERAGAQLSLLYLLDGTDMHHENIIASNDHPQLIDLETLFHARLKSDGVERFVLNTGLLPFYIMGQAGKKGVDVSGLGANPGQTYPTTYCKWKYCNTDEMHLVQVSGKVKKSKNGVICGGKKVRAQKYLTHILSGFQSTYKLIMSRRACFLQSLALLANCSSRFVMRPTRLYFHILQRLSDPQVLLQGHHEVFSPLNVDEPNLKNIVEEEKRALLEGDIPFFKTIPNKTALYTASGACVGEDLLAEPPFQRVCKRVENMSESDCALQLQFIRQSFLVKKRESRPKKNVAPRASNVSSKDLLATIGQVAEELKKSAFRNAQGTIHWIDLERDPLADQYHLQPISDRFYGGKTGIALFFAALSKVCEGSDWKELAYATVADIRNKIVQGQACKVVAEVGIGGYGGAGGIAYALMQMGRLLQDPSLISDSQTLLHSITITQITEDQIFDMIGGSAGLICALVAQDDPSLLPLADAAGDHLCQKALQMPSGIGWAREGEAPLVGFSHGSAGIAYALQKLGSKYHKCANLALDYERSHFNPIEKNWPHLGAGKPSYPTRWCHGATGIGFARIACPHPDAYMEKEIECAIVATKKKMFEGADPTLCCSQLGRFEFLLESARVLNDKSLHREAMQMFASIFSLLKKRPEFSSPGIMQGKAGVGYTLLRIIDPTLPQILLL